MRSTYCRAAMRGELRGIFRKDGTLLRLDFDVLQDAGAYLGNSADYCRAPFGKFFRCYCVPYATLHSWVVSTNTTPSGAFRSWGGAEYYVFMEHLMNRAAEVPGIDPVQLRIRNVLLPGEKDIKMDLPVEEARTRECLEQGAEHFHWHQRRLEDAAHTPYDYGCFSSWSTFVIGRGVQECGKNLRTELLNLASRMLDIPRRSSMWRMPRCAASPGRMCTCPIGKFPSGAF